MSNVHTVEMTDSNYEEVLKKNDITLIDFWASWCGPCKMFGPIFEKAAIKNPNITFAKVDTEAQQGLAGSFNIRSIPTLAIFRDNILLFMQPGMLPEEALEDLIAQTKALDMDKVREDIAKHEAEHHHEEGCEGCGHDHHH